MNMEPVVGAFPDGDWDFSRMFDTEDQLELTPEFLAQYAFPVDSSQFVTPNSTLSSNPDEEVNMAGLEESLFCSWNALNSNLEFISQEYSNSSNSSCSAFFPSLSSETCFFSNSNHIPTTNDSSMSMDICIMDENNGGIFNLIYPQIAITETASEEDMDSDKKINSDDQSQALGDAVSCKEHQLKRKLDVQESKTNPSETPKKRARVTRANKGKKNVQSRKNQNTGADNNEEEENNGQSSSGFSSEDENASQDSNGGENSDLKPLNSNGKTKASRGSATDPQSLYARKRRERINERLRILQNLVPNGTKVDISTMLEEAVHYVKFMQLQIKLLSSNDLWMYAPIAYNGVDVGLNQKFSALL